MSAMTDKKEKKDKTLRFTQAKRERFIEHLRQCGNVTQSAELVAVTRRCVYAHRDLHEDFAKEWDDAIEEAVDRLEQEAWRRAHAGFDEPIIFKGIDTGIRITRYSDQLMTLLLKSHRPEKYRERTSTELSGPGGKPVETISKISIEFVDAVPPQLKKDRSK